MGPRFYLFPMAYCNLGRFPGVKPSESGPTTGLKGDTKGLIATTLFSSLGVCEPRAYLHMNVCRITIFYLGVFESSWP